jgi:sulfite reductase (ferredoxin)
VGLSIFMSTITETAAQRAERLKAEKNPWEALDELRAFAAKGIDAAPAEWLGTYLRWWGVYTQGDGGGALGGRGGVGAAAPYLMLRIRLTNGQIASSQLHTIAEVAAKYARGVADITVRQNIQLHWITLENLPDVLDALWHAGLTTKGSCGDDSRNITGCPLAGRDAAEYCDASPLAHAATAMLIGSSDFYNLPRKFKVSITGCRAWCSYPEINDLAFTARERDGEVGFAARIGGGLSADPHLALPLGVFLRWDDVLPVTRAVAEIFRDADVLRQHRDRARLKHLITRHGWTAEQFRDEIERRASITLTRDEDDDAPNDVVRDHVGVFRQKQDGLAYAGISVLRGRITAAQLHAAASAAGQFGSGALRTTNMQNLLIVDLPEHNVEPLLEELTAAELRTHASPFARGAIACTGTEFCKLAVTETKAFTRWLVAELEERLPEFGDTLKLNVTGCPNSCGQHWIADIGIEGKKIREGDRLVDAYYFCVGGGVGKHAAIARPVGYRCTAAEVPNAIESLLRAFERLRDSGENLRQFLSRHTNEEIRIFLGGRRDVIAERDLPVAAPPHSVEV